MNVKDIIAKNPNCILYFGDNKDLFLSGIKAVGKSKRFANAVSCNAERELKGSVSPAQYVIVVKDGNWSEWNVINSEKHFGKEFWKGFSPSYGIPVFNLLKKSAQVV